MPRPRTISLGQIRPHLVAELRRYLTARGVRITTTPARNGLVNVWTRDASARHYVATWGRERARQAANDHMQTRMF